MRPRDRIANCHFPAHPAGIFALATTPTALLSGSGTSAIHVHRTNDASGTFPLVQVLPAHKLGTHHITTAPRGTSNGTVAASVGFGGDIKVWRCDPATGEFALDFDISPAQAKSRGGSDVWAVALDSLEQFLACTTHDGRIHVWDLTTRQLLRTYETGAAGAGSFGTCIDLSASGNLTATGHENGAVYVFDNNVGSLKYSLTSKFPLCLRLLTGAFHGGDCMLTDWCRRPREARTRSLLLTRQYAPRRRRRCGHHLSLRRPDGRARWHTEHGSRVISVDRLSRLVRHGRVPVIRLVGRQGAGVVDRTGRVRGDAQRD